MTKKTERLIILLAMGWLLISIAYILFKIRNQNIEKENIRLTEQEKYVEQTFDVKMHRIYKEEIMDKLDDVMDLIDKKCK